MRHQAVPSPEPESRANAAPGLAFSTQSHRNAMVRLDSAFRKDQPLAILIGAGKSDTGYLLGSFFDSLGADVAVARIVGPCADAMAGMREIIQAIGFDPKDMKMADLENIFTMFLSFQKTHHRRTVICFEEAQANGCWVLDKVRSLVELETKRKFGLMVILSGRPSLNEMLDSPPLNTIVDQAGQRISLAPFNEEETREYVRWRVEFTGSDDVGQMFEYHAITLMHELCGGIPDTVSALVTKCLQLADETNTTPVTTKLVNKAGRRLRLASMSQPSDAGVEIVQNNPGAIPCGRLIARMHGEVIEECALDLGRVLIGRDKLCDLRIPDKVVSRHHALIIDSPASVKLVDLGSTNGTFVDGRRVRVRELRDGDVISIGDCWIEYVARDDAQAWFFDIDRTENLEPRDVPVNGNGLDRQTDSPDIDAISIPDRNRRDPA